MEMFGFMEIIPILIYFGILFFVIYVVITILNLMKQRNEYLKEIRDEIMRSNKID